MDANRMAEDVYAGSVMYSDEALRRVQGIMQDAADSFAEICRKMNEAIEKEKAAVHKDQRELRSHLEDLRDTNKYMKLIEERNKQIIKEQAKAKKEEEQPSVYAQIKPEIKINEEYFERAGIPLVEEEPQEQLQEEHEIVQPDIKVNLDAEYFKWKEELPEEPDGRKSEKHSLFGKRK